MGNQESQENKHWVKDKLDQIIVKAQYLKRNKSGSGSGSGGLFKHVGILVKTDEGQSYIIHHPGPGEDVISEPFSEDQRYREGWEVEENISVNSRLTIRDAERRGGKGQGYMGNGFCIGVANKIKKALEY